MSMSEAGGPTNPQEAGDAAFLRPVVVVIQRSPSANPAALVRVISGQNSVRDVAQR